MGEGEVKQNKTEIKIRSNAGVYVGMGEVEGEREREKGTYRWTDTDRQRCYEQKLMRSKSDQMYVGRRGDRETDRDREKKSKTFSNGKWHSQIERYREKEKVAQREK